LGTVSGSGDGLRTQSQTNQILIQLRQPGTHLFGLGLFVVALYVTGSGVIGEGIFWWIAIGVGLVSGLLGISVLGQNDRVIVEADRVVWESRFFRAVSQRKECSVAPSDSPAVTMDTHTTGGAFGQPLEDHHTVRVGGEVLYTDSNQSRADALTRSIAGALDGLWGGRKETGASGGTA
jgi:hypothetical protein